MAASGAMPSWTNNASVPPRVIAHPRRGAGISYNYKYKYNTNADKNTNKSKNTNKIHPSFLNKRSINAFSSPRAIAHLRRAEEFQRNTNTNKNQCQAQNDPAGGDECHRNTKYEIWKTTLSSLGPRKLRICQHMISVIFYFIIL